ncbi:MAG TPA: four helix bundle suffix domain-containing protein [Pyrinomonadaceae bacterium]|nr:four helix bundle suffix domain-containing protein [Pyrinomonadaceae bacterium]
MSPESFRRTGLIPAHGGYRHLKSFQVAQLAYDVTMRFCDRYIGKRTRTYDQMVQAARSGVQNIAEGSMASATSKKTELKLTNVARASLEELRLDYEDFLRQRGLALWERNDPRRAELVARRPKTADAVADWARDVRGGQSGLRRRGGHDGQGGHNGQQFQSSRSMMSTASTRSTPSTYAEISANGALTLISVASALLSRQIVTLEKAFLREGGFTEKLYKARTAARDKLR